MSPKLKAGTKRKRVELSHKTKLEILDYYDRNGGTQQETATKFGIHKTTMHFLLKNRDKVKEVSLLNKDMQGHRLRKSNYEPLEKELFNYVAYCQNSGIDISFSKIRTKAQELANKLGIDYIANSGWISRFQKRHRLSPGNGGMKSRRTTNLKQDLKQWISSVQQFAQDYKLSDIFNVDETGLLYNISQSEINDQAYQSKCANGEDSMNRLTVLLGCNASGTEKLKPLIIGKYERQRLFLSIEEGQPVVSYEINDNAWMTRVIFYNWLCDLNETMIKEKRKILLVLDQTHPHSIEKMTLSNLKFLYVPPNISVKQPLESGIVRSFKSFFRYRWIPQSSVTKGDDIEPLELDEAIRFIGESWQEVPQAVIQNAWKRSGILPSLISGKLENADDVDPFILDIVPEKLIDFDDSLCICSSMEDSLADAEMVEVITLTEDDCAEGFKETFDDSFEVSMVNEMPVNGKPIVLAEKPVDVDKDDEVELVNEPVDNTKSLRKSYDSKRQESASPNPKQTASGHKKALENKKRLVNENPKSSERIVVKRACRKDETAHKKSPVKLDKSQTSKIVEDDQNWPEKFLVDEDKNEILVVDQVNSESGEEDDENPDKIPKTPLEVFAAVETIEQFMTEELFPDEQLAMFTQLKEKIACHCMTIMSKKMTQKPKSREQKKSDRRLRK